MGVEMDVEEHRGDVERPFARRAYRIPVKKRDQTNDAVAVTTCVRFDVATPSETSTLRDVSLDQFTFDHGGEYFDDRYTPDEPISVIRRTGTVFGEYYVGNSETIERA